MNLPATLQGLQNFAAAESLAKAGKLLPRAVLVLLVTLVAWQAARLTWLLLPKPAGAVPQVSISAPPPVSAKGVNPQKVADAHLFGVATVGEDPNAIANAPPTPMTLVLTGTIASTDPAKGYAFIGENVQSTKFLKVGDNVAGGSAKLHSVYPEKVMLDRGGRLEALLLPRQGSGLLAARAPPPPMNAQPARFAESVKRIAETNPAAFNEIVRPQARMVQGVMQGFMVYPGRNRQQFAKLGLQPGDLVKAINGTPLDDPQRSVEIFNTLASSDRAQITIERNGQVQQITLNTSQIALPEPEDPTRQTMPPQDIRTDANGAPVQ
jgi:general secretion pathway protein C